ncbi:TetR/AcrR family transcriptional regulator [Caproicibacterium sp. BJN0003]|uniref:TetR/AcrR family transcriptional regulator n=1 Tax=Caproicibacterium sp. BJN0003 TaxID=2994078 RepID=UPI00225BED1A|nr:TetR/AcrR family transcriptional regulator [Caproicibacterium sp. BJN0003]UZT81746.1 TetR/AcrR family transcriptional regulator [Caproicibacterium sp. BJN0003]
MKDENQKAALLKATIGLLEEAEQPEKVTSRQIASRAGVNLAMINYYYGSKEALTSQAVSRILDVSAGIFQTSGNPSESPKERLRHIFIEICHIVVKYQRYTKLYVPHLLLEDEITLPQLILPEIRDHFGTRRSETECRMIAYEMISFLQLVFYRTDAFMRYTGIDLTKEGTAIELIDWELELFLPDSGKDNG